MPSEAPPKPAPAPATTIAVPTPAPVTLQQITTVCNIDNLSPDAKAQLASLSEGMDTAKVRKLLEAYSCMAAQEVASLHKASPAAAAPGLTEEEQCQYNGTLQQVAAWAKAKTK